MEIECKDVMELDKAAGELAEAIGNRKVIAFHGEMGAGKTTLIGALCRALGVEDDVASPTFSIVNEYRDRHDNPIYHFDFYRIESLGEAVDAGTEDYFASGDLCLMEWPELIEPLLPEDTVDVTIRVNNDDSRTITVR